MACGFWAAPSVARALTTQAAGETFTWSVNGSASVLELNRFTAGDVVEIHCATEFAQGKRITVAAAWTPSPILESGGQPIAPYGVGMNIGIPSFDQDEYHSFVATNWYEDVANWPDTPGPMSTAHQEFFYRNSTANVVRLSFMGTWLGNPTNVSRSGTTKWVQIFVWSFSDVYGTKTRRTPRGSRVLECPGRRCSRAFASRRSGAGAVRGWACRFSGSTWRRWPR